MPCNAAAEVKMPVLEQVYLLVQTLKFNTFYLCGTHCWVIYDLLTRLS